MDKSNLIGDQKMIQLNLTDSEYERLIHLLALSARDLENAALLPKTSTTMASALRQSAALDRHLLDKMQRQADAETFGSVL